MKFRVVIEQDEEGMFVAECPALPGCISQGKSRSEAVNSIRDAMKGYLTSLKKHNEAIPPSIDEEIGQQFHLLKRITSSMMAINETT